METHGSLALSPSGPGGRSRCLRLKVYTCSSSTHMLVHRTDCSEPAFLSVTGLGDPPSSFTQRQGAPLQA